MTAMRAARRTDELLTSSSEMVGFQAAGYALGVGAMWCSPRRLIHDAENGLVAQPLFDGQLRDWSPHFSHYRRVMAEHVKTRGGRQTMVDMRDHWIFTFEIFANSMAICLSSG